MKDIRLLPIFVLIQGSLFGFENARSKFWNYAKFFQDNKLAQRVLFNSMEDIDDDSEIWVHDLTEEGVAFYGIAEKKYFGRFSRNSFADPADVRVLEKALKAFREKRSKELN